YSGYLVIPLIPLKLHSRIRLIGKGIQMMKLKTGFKRYGLLILVGGAIPLLLLLSMILHFPQAVTIAVLIILSLAFCSMALWRYANKDADGSEWWQDDSASGWRGY
ncbi:MAG: hypothetical protein WAM60_25525, partial [Candidatus Promineifilaceae bacterium]